LVPKRQDKSAQRKPFKKRLDRKPFEKRFYRKPPENGVIDRPTVYAHLLKNLDLKQLTCMIRNTSSPQPYPA
jgi:hypothetical protein